MLLNWSSGQQYILNDIGEKTTPSTNIPSLSSKIGTITIDFNNTEPYRRLLKFELCF